MSKKIIILYPIIFLVFTGCVVSSGCDNSAGNITSQRVVAPIQAINPDRLVLHYALAKGHAIQGRPREVRATSFQYGANKVFHAEPWQGPSFDHCRDILTRQFPAYGWIIEQKGLVKANANSSFPFSVRPKIKFGTDIHEKYQITMQPFPPKAPRKFSVNDTIQFRRPDGSVVSSPPRDLERDLELNRYLINWISESNGNASGVLYFWTEEKSGTQ